MPLSSERLREIVVELATRPQHEKVRALVYTLLVEGLEAKSSELDFERRVPEVHGRIDALLGNTVFEFKSDLRREINDAENKLPDYISQRERETGNHFVAVVTDGAVFIPYELHSGKLIRFDAYTTRDDGHELLAWLSSVVAVKSDLLPDPDTIRRELGRGSLAWNVTRQELSGIWNEVNKLPEVSLKRDIWSQLIRRVYGTALNEDSLFFQHTYLVIIAKTMAARVLGVDIAEPGDLLSGRRFHEAGIIGMVESDFFDWLIVSEKGSDLVRRIALQAGRFRLDDINIDVLKGLYESLIDTEQRHYLGEYYTPDWLAQKICNETITNPLEQRILDPACGSGTFVFHAVRRLLQAADKAGVPPAAAVDRVCGQVFGIDVHPVSAQIARVTFLLAIGPERLKQRPAVINIPVYLGDSLQWNTEGFLAERHILIEVPGGNELLEFPFEVAQDPQLFDTVIDGMQDLSKQNSPPEGLAAWLEREQKFEKSVITTLTRTYNTLHQLYIEGRNHIWGFVTRNLVRPVWLSQENQKVDIIIGNPPWLSYRFMDGEMQERFHIECQKRGLWVGQVAQQQDMSAYFFARCVELYMKPTGRIAFVMPYAAMTRRQYAGFRTGNFGMVRSIKGKKIDERFASIRFTSAWAFADNVSPLFPVPSCVLFAENKAADQVFTEPKLPDKILSVSGVLPKRDSSLTESEHYLRWQESSWPAERKDRFGEGYAGEFRDGAVVFPSVLLRVELAQTGKLGSNPEAPLVESRRTSLEKLPWKNIPSLRGNLEKEFLRPLYLGESIAPFRILQPILSLVPWYGTCLLNSNEARSQGFVHLGEWLDKAEKLWQQYGTGARTLKEQGDYYGQLSAQLPVAELRVVYSASGTLPAACILKDLRGIVEHKLYWAKVDSEEEGYYLLSILNSETARKGAEHLQSRGQWGARDFDKVILSLPIPKFDSANDLHQALAKAAVHAEEIAKAVELKEGMHFIKARQVIRAALVQDGISAEIDNLVAKLLG